ncbi:diguanylate cyclase [Qipengyuania sp.]|uniref:sensor domain-containing diguanylate cyclase n=1 Tax=Qipengyuania sp. TaxID=2004515 RepID=UPI0035C79094
MFDAITLAVVRGDRIVAERRYEASDLIGGNSSRMLILPVPQAEGSFDSVLAAFDGPTSRGLFTDASLEADNPSQRPEALTSLLLAAIVCGILLMPLAFNFAFYRVLKERFLIWHLVVSLGLLLQCLLTSGVVGHFVELSLYVYSRLIVLSLGISISAALGFAAAFIEPDRLDPRIRKALYICAWQVIGVSLLHAFFPDVMRGVQTSLYYASFVPAMVLFVVSMVDAIRRKSRAVRFQIVAWTPFFAMGVIRVVTMLNTSVAQQEAMQLFYFAMVIESIATSLGVADRFMTIKQQRDRAVSHAHSMTQLSERDALTGLYNRRVLEGHLQGLERQGFTGFAVIDLDNFKRVNDTHGHALGDTVLSVAASVFEGDPDTVAVRLGGEEFLLLLRGNHVASRVERMREAIPVRIAREVAALEMLVTASAGLIESGERSTLKLPFEELYRLADSLLYEAKHNGRNLLSSRTLDLACDEDRSPRAVAQLAG